MSGAFPALAGNPRVNAADPAAMLSTISHGRNMMPSWKGQLSAGDIAAVATYVSTAWGIKGGPVAESDVATLKYSLIQLRGKSCRLHESSANARTRKGGLLHVFRLDRCLRMAAESSLETDRAYNAR